MNINLCQIQPGQEPGPLVNSKPKLPTDQQAGTIAVRLMGPNGPLRLFSTTRFPGSTAYESPTYRGFAGDYSCDLCGVLGEGVYRVEGRWLCGPCKPKPANVGRRGAYPAVADTLDKLIVKLAAKNKLKIQTDEDQTRIIAGRFGHIYEYDPHTLAVLYSSFTSTWPRRRKSGTEIGMTVLLDGDMEGSLQFDPANAEQAKLAIKVAGVKRKQPRSAQQQESLSRARSLSPLNKSGVGSSQESRPSDNTEPQNHKLRVR